MEKELSELRAKLTQQGSPVQHTPIKISASVSASPTIPQMQSSIDQYMGSQEAVASLLDLRSGGEGGSYLRSSNGTVIPSRRIESVVLVMDSVRQLFHQYALPQISENLMLKRPCRFFTYYHPFLPLLDPKKSPDDYYTASPLLFWVVIATAARRYEADLTLLNALSGPLSRLLWATLQSVPQNYFVVKALCILCTWPMPISSTTIDPTFMLSGLMMQIALQIGLHRPSHAQDFTKFKVELREEELKDRVRTWASCNAVAQR